MLESDLEMGIEFQTEIRDLSVGKRFRDSEEVSEDELEEIYVEESDYDNAEANKKYYSSHGDCLIEVFLVIVNREGYVSGKVIVDTGSRIKDIYNGEEYVTREVDLLLTGPDEVMLTYDSVVNCVDLYHKPLALNPKRRNTRFNKGSFSQPRRITNCEGCFGEQGEFRGSKYRGFYWGYFTGQHLFDPPLSHKVTSGKLTATV